MTVYLPSTFDFSLLFVCLSCFCGCFPCPTLSCHLRLTILVFTPTSSLINLSPSPTFLLHYLFAFPPFGYCVLFFGFGLFQDAVTPCSRPRAGGWTIALYFCHMILQSCPTSTTISHCWWAPSPSGARIFHNNWPNTPGCQSSSGWAVFTIRLTHPILLPQAINCILRPSFGTFTLWQPYIKLWRHIIIIINLKYVLWHNIVW